MDYHSIDEALKDIGLHLMGYYNWQRLHTANDGMTPAAAAKILIYCPELVGHYNMQSEDSKRCDADRCLKHRYDTK